MKFQRRSWTRPVLSAALIGLFFSFAPIRAAEKHDQNIAIETDEEIDMAKVQAGGKVVLMSSGARGVGFRAIDDDHRTTFQFSKSDSRPTLVVQLLENRPVHRVSAIVGSVGGKIDVYLLNDLPHQPSDLDSLQPVGSIVDLVIAHEASVEFAPQNARYVALRWTLPGTHFDALNVAEVSAFTRGGPPITAAALAVDPPVYLAEGPPIVPTISP